MVTSIYATTIVAPYITPTTLYNSVSIPFFNLNINQKIHAANTATFESIAYLPEASKVTIIGDHLPFSGQVVKVKKTVEGYTYDCMDYTRTLFGKISLNRYKQTSDTIIKSILKGVGLGTGNISKGKYHTHVAWKDAKKIDIINQLATLEGYEFFINPDGVPIYRKIPTQTNGYAFYSVDAVTDFDIEYDINDIITGVSVYGKDDKYYYSGQNSTMVHKYGNLVEIIRDSEISSVSAAKTKAAKLFAEKGYPSLSMSITLPKILPLQEGTWIVFIPPAWVEQPKKAYYIESVKTNITDDGETQILDLLEAKPNPPEDWVYRTESTATSSGSAGGSTSVDISGIKISGLKTPKDVRKWVDANIKYQYYFDSQKTNKQVLSSKRANCVDQSELCIAMCKGIGYNAKISYGHTCSGVGHANWLVYWNGRWRRGDTVCHKQSEF